MDNLTKPHAPLLLTTRYAYTYSHIAETEDTECWICRRPYFLRDPNEDGDQSIRVPIALSCTHVVGKHCFGIYRASSGDVELCPLCRQKLQGPAVNTLLLRMLVRLSQTEWFKWHDSEVFRDGSPMLAYDVEVKLPAGEVLTDAEMLKLVLIYENYRA
jgi:hypothetical protein